MRSKLLVRFLHDKAGTKICKMNSICRRSAIYPVARIEVSPELVPWNVPFPAYSPPVYSAGHLLKAPWADPDVNDPNFKPKWNAIDEGVNRESYEIKHYDVIDKYPMNPKGRTGLRGRGRLGRWGPNHAADAILTRWKRDEQNYQIFDKNGMPILQFLAILRNDCKQWATPGGFLDVNESPSTAALRELLEEAVNSKNFSLDYKEAINKFFSFGKVVFKGYVDDPRNTDNAWIETTAICHHDPCGKLMDGLELDARDDAGDAKWIDVVDDLQIYETHNPLIEAVYKFHMDAYMSYLSQIHSTPPQVIPPLHLHYST